MWMKSKELKNSVQNYVESLKICVHWIYRMYRIVCILWKSVYVEYIKECTNIENCVCGAQVIYGPSPFTRGESTSPSRGGLWPKPDNIKNMIALGYSRGQFSPRQNPKSHRTEGQKRYKTKLERKSKISRESCPYCHSILCTWQSRILQLL